MKRAGFTFPGVLARFALCALCALFALCAWSGCASRGRVRSHIDALQSLLANPGPQVLRACAPRELALAETHLRFALMELDEGNEPRAAEHVAVAEPNVRAARWLSSPERCAAAGPAPAVRAGASADAGPAARDAEARPQDDAALTVENAARDDAGATDADAEPDAGRARDSDD